MGVHFRLMPTTTAMSLKVFIAALVILSLVFASEASKRKWRPGKGRARILGWIAKKTCEDATSGFECPEGSKPMPTPWVTCSNMTAGEPVPKGSGEWPCKQEDVEDGDEFAIDVALVCVTGAGWGGLKTVAEPTTCLDLTLEGICRPSWMNKFRPGKKDWTCSEKSP